MLITENELLDDKLELETNNENERDGLLDIKNNLETLLGSIKHAIVLLQIAKVSLKNFSTDSPSPSPAPPPRRAHRQSSSTSSSSSITKFNTGRKLTPMVAKSPVKFTDERSSESVTTTTTTTSNVTNPTKGAAQGSELNKLQQQQPRAVPASAEAAQLLVSNSSPAADFNTNPPSETATTSCDDDDDDAFYDAADEQHNRSNVTSTPDVNDFSQQQATSSTVKRSPRNSFSDSDSVKNDNEFLSIRTNSIQTNDSTKMSPHLPADGQDNLSNNNNNNNSIEDEIDWDALYETEDEEDLGSLESQGSVIKHLLSQIRIGMDLTKVVLPTFILERRSLLEMYADFFAHPDLFSSIPDYETPEERMIQLVKWYLSAFHAGRKSSVAKKPYNPILGEIFRCHWNLNSKNGKNTSSNLNDDIKGSVENTQDPENGNLTFVAEQVSHHPPVSAFYAENKDKSISCCAHIYTKSKYLGLSVGVHNVGEGVIYLSKHNETYVCTFPSAFGRSILTVPWVELGGSVTITCQETGYAANIEFVTKPFYGGKKHRVLGEMLRPNKSSFMSIDGEWNGIMHCKAPPSSSEKQIYVDTTNLPVIKKHVRLIRSQETYESRNVWKEVTRALKLHDVASATAAKSFIEQRQRDQLKERMEKGIKWKTRYFEAVDEGWKYVGLSND